MKEKHDEASHQKTGILLEINQCEFMKEIVPRPLGVTIQSADEHDKQCSRNTAGLWGDNGDFLP